jgi:hypothetical protein
MTIAIAGMNGVIIVIITGVRTTEGAHMLPSKVLSQDFRAIDTRRETLQSAAAKRLREHPDRRYARRKWDARTQFA